MYLGDGSRSRRHCEYLQTGMNDERMEEGGRQAGVYSTYMLYALKSKCEALRIIKYICFFFNFQKIRRRII